MIGSNYCGLGSDAQDARDRQTVDDARTAAREQAARDSFYRQFEGAVVVTDPQERELRRAAYDLSPAGIDSALMSVGIALPAGGLAPIPSEQFALACAALESSLRTNLTI